MRPGPISVGFPAAYAQAKNEGIEPPVYLRGIENLTKDTYGVFIYQETLMQISRQVSGFTISQSDSIMRKIIAKKKKDKLEMLRRCLIYGKKNTEGPENWQDNPKLPWYDPTGKMGPEIPGAIANGYTEEEMNHFYENIQGFASYAFNKSHSYTYSYISVLQAYLKYYYPVQFFAATLSIEEDDEKRKKYIRVAENFAGIKVLPPDINISERNFTCDPKKKIIYYGLAKIKGVGDTSIQELIDKRPYVSLKDMNTRLTSKAFNKRIAMSLIRSGACDSFNSNRLELLKELYTLRKDKFEDFDTSVYSKQQCIDMEQDTLGINLTYKFWWETIKNGTTVQIPEAFILDIKEWQDKRGRLMAFVQFQIEDSEVSAVIFASTYSKYQAIFQNKYARLTLTGKKENDKFIVNKAGYCQET